MDGFNFLGFLSSWRLMLILLLLYAGFAIADLFKRHLLSNAVVYWITMLLAPFAAAAAVVVPVIELLAALSNDEEQMNWGKIILLFIGGGALLLLVAAVYIRGHIAPLNKASEKYGNNKKYFASKRLIKVGYAGMLLYAVPFIIMSCVMITLISTGTVAFSYIFISAVEEYGIIGIVYFIIMIFAMFLIPIVNLAVICMLIFLGIQTAAWGITAVAVLLVNILIANGCIRYILTTDMTKGKKALWIFLSLIPAFNFVYGIRCLTKINKYLKETQFS